jgi:hypothetical protein
MGVSARGEVELIQIAAVDSFTEEVLLEMKMKTKTATTTAKATANA